MKNILVPTFKMSLLSRFPIFNNIPLTVNSRGLFFDAGENRKLYVPVHAVRGVEQTAENIIIGLIEDRKIELVGYPEDTYEKITSSLLSGPCGDAYRIEV